MPSPSLPDHCISTFKYFLPACGLKLRAEQIKNTKTILRTYIRDIDGVYRSLSTTKNYSKNNQAGNFLRHWLLQMPGQTKNKESK